MPYQLDPKYKDEPWYASYQKINEMEDNGLLSSKEVSELDLLFMTDINSYGNSFPHGKYNFIEKVLRWHIKHKEKEARA